MALIDLANFRWRLSREDDIAKQKVLLTEDNTHPRARARAHTHTHTQTGGGFVAHEPKDLFLLRTLTQGQKAKLNS